MDEDAVKQQRIMYIAVGGLIMTAVGILGTVVLMLLGAMALVSSGGRAQTLYALSSLPILLTVAGIAMLIYGLGAGAMEAFGNSRNKPVRQAGPCYVTSCHPYVDNNLVIDLDLYDPDEITWVVKMRFPDGSHKNFETAPEVVNSLGEGLWGNITYQGKWLSSFQRVLVDPQRT